MRRSVWLATGLFVAILLGACAPTRWIAPRLRLRAETRKPLPAGERWWQVLLHIHSVLNFAWLYDSDKEIEADERHDRLARRMSRTSSMRSYDPDAIDDLLLRAARARADAMILTEHNTLVHAEDVWLRRRRGPTHLLRQATEWTTWRGGHALVLGLKTPLRPRNSRKAKAADYLKMVDKANAIGATVIVNHPTTPGSPWKKLGIPRRAHAVEVLNAWPFNGRSSEALWHTALRAGARLAAIGGADWHATQGPPLPGGWRLTEVRSPSLSEEAIYAAIKGGRTVAVTGRPGAATVRLLVDGRCREGDDCIVSSTQPFSISVEASHAAGLVLEVYDEQSASPEAPALRLPVPFDRYRVDLSRRLGAGGSGFVRASLRGISLRALGSAVYLRTRPEEKR